MNKRRFQKYKSQVNISGYILWAIFSGIFAFFSILIIIMSIFFPSLSENFSGLGTNIVFGFFAFVTSIWFLISSRKILEVNNFEKYMEVKKGRIVEIKARGNIKDHSSLSYVIKVVTDYEAVNLRDIDDLEKEGYYSKKSADELRKDLSKESLDEAYSEEYTINNKGKLEIFEGDRVTMYVGALSGDLYDIFLNKH
jgi:hypothetical protein